MLAYSPGMKVEAAIRSELTSGRQQRPYSRSRVGYVMKGRSQSTERWGVAIASVARVEFLALYEKVLRSSTP